MAPPQVSIYVTSLTSQPKVRQQTAALKRALDALEIPYTEHDLVNEPDAKTRWRRSKPPGVVVGLPGYLVGGEWVGTMEDFEQAVEDANLPSFLKQDVDLGGGSLSIGEAELEKLMREMTAEDLDALAAEVGADSSAGKVGLMVPEGAIPVNQVGEEKETVEIGSDDAPPEAKDARKSTPPLEARKGETEEDGGLTATIQNAAATVVDTVKDVKDQVVDSATAQPTLSPLDTKSAPVRSSLSTPSPNSATSPNPITRTRRMSKEEIAKEMANADSVDSLLEAVGKASTQKEKTD